MDGVHELLTINAYIDTETYLQSNYGRSDDLVVSNILKSDEV